MKHGDKIILLSDWLKDIFVSGEAFIYIFLRLHSILYDKEVEVEEDEMNGMEWNHIVSHPHPSLQCDWNTIFFLISRYEIH